MTQPEPTPTLDGATVPDEESLAFELAAVAVVTGAVSAAVASVIGLAFAAYAASPDADGRSLGRKLAARLRWLRWPPMAPALRKVAMDARDLGVRRAVESLSEPVSVDWRSGPPLELPDPDKAVSEAVEQAARLAETLPMDTMRDLRAVQGRANTGVSQARGHARWAANEGINAGVSEVARAAGLRLIWVSERNACLHCLGHAGYAVEPGDTFPIVSFDPLRPDMFGAVPFPPLHPNCRCQVRTYDGPAGRPPQDRTAPAPAARLAAEARRSVVYQWTDFASGVRARAAAERLLDVGASLPKSVEDRAGRALRSGRTVNRPT
jgi:hypothetical protein